MSVPQCTSASTAESFPYPPPSPTQSQEPDHPLAALIGVAQDSQLSCESRLLLVILTLMAWTKGRCWPGIETQAGYLGRSEDSITRYHRELESHGLLIINRSGKHNQYYPAILQGQAPRPKPQQPHRTHAGHGGASTRTHAALTPKSTELQNVKNVPSEPPQRPEWLEGYWDHLRQQNDENVDKSWPSEEDVPDRADPGEPEMHAPDHPATRTDAEIQKPLYSSANSGDRVHQMRATGDPDTPTPDTEQVQETSAFSQDHGDRLRVHPTPDTPVTNTEETKKTSAKFENRDRGDRGDSPVRAPGEHGAGTRIRKVFDTTLLNEILEITGDHKSKGCWISCVARLPEEEIRIAMSSLRIAMAESDVYRPGAYMLGVIRSRNPDFTFAGKGKKKNHGQDHDHVRVPPTAYAPSDHVPSTPPRPVVFTPSAPPEPPPPSIEELVKGWRFASRSISIPRLLEIMKTSVGDALDPSELWREVKDLCPGKDERTLLDRFLEVLLTRLKHKAAQAKE